MFTQAANFSNIVEYNNLYVSKVVHKAYVNVNENGTEAAAASGNEVLIPYWVLVFIFDFLFLLILHTYRFRY